MNVLVVGDGGREHSIIHKISQNKNVKKIYCAGKNKGLSYLCEVVDIATDDFASLVNFAKEKDIYITIASMDNTLVAGIVDEFEKNNLKIFGPNKKASIIEGSKAFSKQFMQKYNIPTAKYKTFSEYNDAIMYIKNITYPIVIKADGLALGKGVVICEDEKKAEKTLEDIMVNKKFGSSGEKIIIEEFLIGEEVSILCFCDGKTIVPMVSAKDHKKAYDGDKGENTGGMGTISPSKYYTKDIENITFDTIIKPTMNGLIKENIHFVGVLFFGLMLTKDGPKVIEYNARFGDPETQVVLPRLKTDLLLIIEACLEKNLHNINIEWEDCATSCVILASDGYPVKYEKGFEILGIDEVNNMNDIYIYQAGITFKDEKYFTNGGRVLGVMGKGDNLDISLKKVYDALKKVSFKGAFYRKDIGKI